MSVDVVVLTKNSERMLRECLEAVYENVPVNRLIIVDGYSTDATLTIVKEFNEKYGNVVVVRDRGTRGTARQKGIREVKTDWFMFVDSDVILCDKWFKKAEALIKERVGAVWGIEIWSVLKNSKMLKLFERITMKIFEKKGGTHDLLVRRETVEDICIPPHLHTYEDRYIKKWICKKGYEIIPAYDPYCVHYRPEDVWTIKKSVFLIANEIKLAIHNPQLLFSFAFYAAIVLHQNALSYVKARRPLPKAI